MEGTMTEETNKKVTIDLELNSTLNESSENRYQSLIDFAKMLNHWRIFPRVFLTVYIILLYDVVQWAMMLETMSTQQSGLVSVVVGVGAAWFMSYVNSGPGKGKDAE
jgi:hypothetical protein